MQETNEFKPRKMVPASQISVVLGKRRYRIRPCLTDQNITMPDMVEIRDLITTYSPTFNIEQINEATEMPPGLRVMKVSDTVFEVREIR